MKDNKQKGFVRLVIIFIIALLVLSYFGFNLKATVESPTTQSNFNYVTGIIVNIWHKYLEAPAKYLWNDIFIELIWEPSIRDLRRVGNHEPTSLIQDAPRLPRIGSIE